MFNAKTRTAEEAQALIEKLKPYVAPTEEQLKALERMRVDYGSIEEFPPRKLHKIYFCIDWIRRKFDPPTIDLVRSQLEGYPVDEFTDQKLFESKVAVFGSAKFSDWDFVVPTVPNFQQTFQIAPLIKVDLFKIHHGGVRKLRIYENWNQSGSN